MVKQLTLWRKPKNPRGRWTFRRFARLTSNRSALRSKRGINAVFRGLIALSAALVFALVAALPAKASSHRSRRSATAAGRAAATCIDDAIRGASAAGLKAGRGQASTSDRTRKSRSTSGPSSGSRARERPPSGLRLWIDAQTEIEFPV
jgi:hypothetical protein